MARKGPDRDCDVARAGDLGKQRIQGQSWRRAIHKTRGLHWEVIGMARMTRFGRRFCLIALSAGLLPLTGCVFARGLIRRAFDRNRDGQLDAQERAGVRLILYGQSFGGAAVVKLARELERTGVPVLLTVQVDSVGRGDGIIPANVARAANLFQRNGLFIRGEPKIRAQDPSSTTIIGNFDFDYRNKKIDISEVSWMKKLIRVAHVKMEFDPAVWALVEELIEKEIKRPDDERHN